MDAVIQIIRRMVPIARGGKDCLIVCGSEARVDAFRAELHYSYPESVKNGQFLFDSGCIRFAVGTADERSDQTVLHIDSSVMSAGKAVAE